MRDNWCYTIAVLLLTTASLGTSFSQKAERAARNTTAEVECDVFNLEGLAPGMTYTDVGNVLKARNPRPRSTGKQRRYEPDAGWQVIHGWQVEAGTVEVWYEGRKASRKENPTVVRVRLLIPQDSMTVEDLWQSVFDRFGPMGDWEREDCNIKAVVGQEDDQLHTTLTLLSWAGATTDAEN